LIAVCNQPHIHTGEPREGGSKNMHFSGISFNAGSKNGLFSGIGRYAGSKNGPFPGIRPYAGVTFLC
jgi:hypothetical protein